MSKSISEEDDVDDLLEKRSKGKKSLIKEPDFVKTLQQYPCLLDTSQTLEMKTKKQIKNVYSLHFTTSQIKKKIENMKARDKSKGKKVMILGKPEKQLLGLMDFKNKIRCAEQGGILATIKDSDDDEHSLFQKEKEELSEKSWQVSSPKKALRQVSSPKETPRRVSSPKGDIQSSQCSVIDLKKELLLQQRELNNQQRELNDQQKEMFALQREKLLLEIELLRKKLN